MSASTACVRRIGPGALVVLLLWLSPGLPWCSPCQAATSAGMGTPGEFRLPLVLIAEPSREPAGVPKEFTAACVREGYIEGTSLFQVTPAPFPDLDAGARNIAQLVADYSSRVPSGKVDVIACGVSGLVARLAIDAGMIPDRMVGNLVMVAAPNRGSFLACLLKSIVEIARQESMFEKDSRSWRFLPLGEDLLSLFSKSTGDEGPEYNRLTYPRDVEWSDEAGWIAERVGQVYEPLYARYVETRFSAIPYVPAESPKETFAGWISRTMPQFWESAVLKSALPPDGSAAYPSRGPSVSQPAPPPGKDIAAAYYEILAMEVAKNQYVMRMASKGSVVESVLKEPYVPTGWKDALVNYGIRILQHYARKALLTVKAGLQETLVNQVVRRTGYIEDSSSPLLRRLIKEDLIVNLGSSFSRRFERVPANAYLSALNGASLERSETRKARYISIGARLASPWSLLWPQLGPNDFFLEVDSTVAPTGPRDCQRIFTGLFSPSGEGLLESKDVQAYVFSMLSGGPRATPGSSLPVGATGTRRVLGASTWGPAYLEPEHGAKVAGVTLPDPPSGWQFQAWTEGGEAASPECASFRYIPTGGTYNLDASLGRIGLRLARVAPLNPIQGSSVTSAYCAEKKADAQVGPPNPDSGQVAGGVPAEGSGGPGSSDPEGDEVAMDPALSAYPLVRVINRSKRTTHEEPKETYHGSWLLDYGDGQTEKIDGNPVLTFAHVYPQEGVYRMRAESYDNRGDLLLEREWKVTVKDGDDAEKEFSCRSIPRLSTELELSGPAMWVTGKPAVYSANLRIVPDAGVEVVSIEYDPGPKFCVLWERSGDFMVSCAATVRLRYSLEGETLSVQNTYLTERTVSVLTTGVTR